MLQTRPYEKLKFYQDICEIWKVPGSKLRKATLRNLK